jgi:hypothetical protein
MHKVYNQLLTSDGTVYNHFPENIGLTYLKQLIKIAKKTNSLCCPSRSHFKMDYLSICKLAKYQSLSHRLSLF